MAFNIKYVHSFQCVKRSHIFGVALRSRSLPKKRSASPTSLLLKKRSGTPPSLPILGVALGSGAQKSGAL